jgi:hypothetical protein
MLPPNSRHYSEVAETVGEAGVEPRIRGGGGGGKVSFKRCRSNCWSESGWV